MGIEPADVVKVLLVGDTTKVGRHGGLTTKAVADRLGVPEWETFQMLCWLGARREVLVTTAPRTTGVFWYVTSEEIRASWPKQPNPFFIPPDVPYDGVSALPKRKKKEVDTSFTVPGEMSWVGSDGDSPTPEPEAPVEIDEKAQRRLERLSRITAEVERGFETSERDLAWLKARYPKMYRKARAVNREVQ